VTTQLAEQLMSGSPWPTTGRNTVRKDLRAFARRGLLTVVDLDSRRIYHPTTSPEGQPLVSRHTRVDHAKVSAALREQPGQWLPVGEYRNPQTSDRTACMIRTGYHAMARWYGPAGAFETRTRLTEDGTLLEARFVGVRPTRPSPLPPTFDADRVLGQIERGEAWVGPTAARKIAARHEEAYGAAFRGSPADVLLWQMRTATAASPDIEDAA
jgi:hypothetical protein